MAGHKYYKRGRGSAYQRAAWQFDELDAQWRRDNPGKLTLFEKLYLVGLILLALLIILSFF